MDPKLGPLPPPLLPLLPLLLLWCNLSPVVPDAVSLCDVSCSTDYDVSFNCSCGTSAVSHPVLIQVSCRSGDDEVRSTCEVEPPRSWCEMHPDTFEDVLSVETVCRTTAVALVGNTVHPVGSSSWQLGKAVKPHPPFDVRVLSKEESYTITWNHSNQLDCLTYRLRMRPSDEASKQDQVDIEVMEDKHFTLNSKKLKPSLRYNVIAQAKMCPGNLYEGPWSEWSHATEWKTQGDETEGHVTEAWHKWYLAYLSPPFFIFIIGIVVYLVIKLWKIKIPNPNEFFTPLYDIYGGNFKEWVKPVFREYDYDVLRISSQLPTTSEKQLEVGQTATEKQRRWASSSGAKLFPTLQPRDNSLMFYLEGGHSDCAGHSAGQVSIHTVTLSGDRKLLEEALSESSPSHLGGHQDRDNLGVFGGDERDQAAFLFEELAAGQNGHSGVSENLQEPARHSSAENLNFRPLVNFEEAEGVSLDSFVFNEHSDDGYPHVDLDTVDSGFGECGSPAASDSNESEPTNSLHEYKSSHQSNYVKQWVACSMGEDG